MPALQPKVRSFLTLALCSLSEAKEVQRAETQLYRSLLKEFREEELESFVEYLILSELEINPPKYSSREVITTCFIAVFVETSMHRLKPSKGDTQHVAVLLRQKIYNEVMARLVVREKQTYPKGVKNVRN